MTRKEKKEAKAAAAAAALAATETPTETVVLPPIEDVVLTVTEGTTEELIAEAPADLGSEVEAVLAELDHSGSTEPTFVAMGVAMPDTTVSFAEIMAQFDAQAVNDQAMAIGKSIDLRAVFENEKDAGNGKIQKTLENARKRLITSPVVRAIMAANVNPDVFNRSIHDGSRYNVYAIGKLADALNGIADHGPEFKGAIHNAINYACMRSLFACRAAGVAFTGDMAKMCVSDKIRAEAAVTRHLTRHTVAASTASTQASSTMQALETLGVVSRAGGKNPTYTLTTNPVVARLEAIVMAA